MTWKFNVGEIVVRRGDGVKYVVVELRSCREFLVKDGRIAWSDGSSMYALGAYGTQWSPMNVEKSECEFFYESTGERAERAIR